VSNIPCEEALSVCKHLMELTYDDETTKKASAYQCLVIMDFHKGITRDIIDCVEKKFDINVTDIKSPNGMPLVAQNGAYYNTAHKMLFDILQNLKLFPFEEYTPLAETTLVRASTSFPAMGILKNEVPVYSLVQSIYDKVPEKDKNRLSKVLHLIACVFQNSGIIKLSEYQAKYIEKIAIDIINEGYESGSQSPVYMIDAPVGTGKTEIFFFAVLLNALLGKRSIIVYPRKALETDQAQRLLNRLEELKKCDDTIRVPRLFILDGDSIWLRGCRGRHGLASIIGKDLHCPRHKTPLKVQCNDGQYRIICDNGHEIDYLMIFRDDVLQKPEIIITNRYLLMTSAIREYRSGNINDYQASFFKDVSLLVFDEAHVYTNLEGGDLALFLRAIRDLVQQYGGKLRLIFSSATVPNPQEFASKLAGVPENEVFYIPYQSPGFNVDRYKLNIVATLMPTPRFSAETLLQVVVLASMLWLRKYGYKGIVFVDSRTEISRVFHYIYETILERGGYDAWRNIAMPGDVVIYHTSVGIHNLVQRDRYFTKYQLDKNSLWDSLVNIHEVEQCIQNYGRCSLINELKDRIKMTYGWENKEERQKVFSWFKSPGWKLLFSTSSTELGIDVGDVSLIIQYKPPIRSEGFIQRLGRAGRNFEKTMGIAFGILVLPQTLQSAMYMYDEEIQGRLVDVNKLPPYKINVENEMLLLRATIYYSLMKALKDGMRTYWPSL